MLNDRNALRLSIVALTLFFLQIQQVAGQLQRNDRATKNVCRNKKQSHRTIQFTEHLIADKFTYVFGIAAADFDGDGDLDLSSADALPNNMLYLFENNGAGKFKKHVIQKDDPQRLERHMAGDVDSDGDLDIVIVKNLNGHLIWFENSGKPNDGKLWKRHVITTKLPGAYDVALADFNKDGHLDVAASSWLLGNQFAWFENSGKPAQGEWKKHLIEKDIRETRTMRAADFDGDGDPDLLGTARLSNEVVWYENTKKGERILWLKHTIDKNSDRPVHGNPVDMDGDGDMDIVMAIGGIQPQRPDENQIVWYENIDSRKDNWKKHVVQKKFGDALEAVAADLDGDGDIDIAATAHRDPTGRVAWFENTGDSRKGWVYHLLKDNWRSANQVIIADLNGDGKPDIIACAERGSNELRWWRNEGIPAK